MTENVDVIICASAEQLRGYTVPGAIEEQCMTCGWPVLLSPSGQRLRSQAPKLKVMCTECAGLALTMRPEQVKLAPGAELELRQWRHRN